MSDTIKNWTEWLKKSRFTYLNDEQKEQTLKWLFQVRDKVLARANLKPDDILIDIGSGTGLLAFGAHEFLKNSGKVIISDVSEDCVEECRKVVKSANSTEGFEFLISGAANINLPDNSVDAAVMRSVIVHILDKLSALKEIYRILKPGGRISIFEPVISSNTKYYELISPDSFSDYEKIKEIENKIMTDKNDSLTNFDDKSLVKDFKMAGFKNINLELNTEQSTYQVAANMIDHWFNIATSPGGLTLKERFLKHMSEDEISDFLDVLRTELDGKTITVKTYSAYISAEKS